MLLTREWYMHPNGQLPAYEWAFGDVNPPVHAWGAWRVYTIDRKQRGLCRDDVVGEIIAGRIRFQLSGLSWWKSTARAGTTVEIACL